MKKIIDFLRAFVLAIFILYVFDKMAVSLDIFIPINVFTIFIVGLFNVWGLVLLIAVYFII